MKEAGVPRVAVDRKDFQNAYALSGIKGKVKACEEIGDTALDLLIGKGEPFEIFFPAEDAAGMIIVNTLKKDLRKDTNQALAEIYRKLRPGEPHTMESAANLFRSLFFNPQKYNFSRIGRLKFNIKLGKETSLEEKVLQPRDYVDVISYLLNLRRGEGDVDDIDHLGNRRVRSVGELVENAFRIGLTRMERTIKEKMTITLDLPSAMPQDLINSKPVIAALKEFFGSSQLSQFMDQINSLSEVTHKRRLSALGPGGLSRERAGFEVRDIQSSHYGRICPVETPEGPNIGLISSLSSYARVNEYGFIETTARSRTAGSSITSRSSIPAIRVQVRRHRQKGRRGQGGRLPEAEGRPPSSRRPAELPLLDRLGRRGPQYRPGQRPGRRGRPSRRRARLRPAGGQLQLLPREQIDYIDVSPSSWFRFPPPSFPSWEHDDANRALMGSNMQRQAVPLLRPVAPLVGTGVEHLVAKGSGDVIVCKRSGTIAFVDAERILVHVDEANKTKDYEVATDLYVLTKFLRTNQNTCFTQRPIVRKGDAVVKGQVLADSSCTDLGELALGRNIVAAFMPWRGYNFEDAIVVSERLIKKDVFTSLHIVEETIEARDTKLGPEEITRDIPNVPENVLRNLDENGIVRIQGQRQGRRRPRGLESPPRAKPSFRPRKSC